MNEHKDNLWIWGIAPQFLRLRTETLNGKISLLEKQTLEVENSHFSISDESRVCTETKGTNPPLEVPQATVDFVCQVGISFSEVVSPKIAHKEV
jgi:predicted RNA methylase